ncbi:MAG TPA: hypothetical protein PK675_05715 [Clostridia bacterium]|nr:hypothetical protein [Clostridia bacterium]
MKKKVTKAKLFWTQTISYIVAITPITALFIWNWGKYTASLGGKWSLFGCGGIAIILFVLITMNKIKMPSFFVFSVIMAVISFVLEPVVQDSKWIWGAVALGTGIDAATFQPIIKRMKKALDRDKQAKESAIATLEILKENPDIFSGRT